MTLLNNSKLPSKQSSKVIEGRMLALRADKTNLTKFSERAEELAEQYRRSLCDEGYAKDRTKELALTKTVELCRKNITSTTVDAIIASKTFSEPKEVIATMIVEINNLKQLRSSAQYTHKNGNKKYGNGQSHNKFHKNNNNGNSNSNSNFNSNSNGNRFGNSGYKQNSNSGR